MRRRRLEVAVEPLQSGGLELGEGRLVHESERGAEVNPPRCDAHGPERRADLLDLGPGLPPPGGDDAYPDDAVGLRRLRRVGARLGTDPAEDVAARLVARRLRAPFAILGAAARLDVDDAAQVELAAGAGYGNLVGGGIEGLLVGAAGQPKGLLGRDVATGEDPLL